METNEATIYKKGFSPEQRQSIIAQWKQSGKNKMAFSKEVGINYHTFISWISPKNQKKISKVRVSKPAAGFSEVRLTSSTNGNLFARLIFGKTSVDLFQPVSPDFLRRLLNQ